MHMILLLMYPFSGLTTCDRLFSWAPKSLQTMTAAMKLKRCLLLGRKAMTNLDSILKSKDITLLTKVHLVKAMVFPVVMYGYESWTIRKLSAKELMLLNCGWISLQGKGLSRVFSSTAVQKRQLFKAQLFRTLHDPCGAHKEASASGKPSH